ARPVARQVLVVDLLVVWIDDARGIGRVDELVGADRKDGGQTDRGDDFGVGRTFTHWTDQYTALLRGLRAGVEGCGLGSFGGLFELLDGDILAAFGLLLLDGGDFRHVDLDRSGLLGGLHRFHIGLGFVRLTQNAGNGILGA